MAALAAVRQDVRIPTAPTFLSPSGTAERVKEIKCIIIGLALGILPGFVYLGYLAIRYFQAKNVQRREQLLTSVEEQTRAIFELINAALQNEPGMYLLFRNESRDFFCNRPSDSQEAITIYLVLNRRRKGVILLSKKDLLPHVTFSKEVKKNLSLWDRELKLLPRELEQKYPPAAALHAERSAGAPSPAAPAIPERTPLMDVSEKAKHLAPVLKDLSDPWPSYNHSPYLFTISIRNCGEVQIALEVEEKGQVKSMGTINIPNSAEENLLVSDQVSENILCWNQQLNWLEQQLLLPDDAHKL